MSCACPYFMNKNEIEGCNLRQQLHNHVSAMGTVGKEQENQQRFAQYP